MPATPTGHETGYSWSKSRGGLRRHGWVAICFQACERLDADVGDPTATVVPFPAPAYDPDRDRFELTLKGEAYLNGAAGQPLA
jgi:hypothetical protein